VVGTGGERKGHGLAVRRRSGKEKCKRTVEQRMRLNRNEGGGGRKIVRSSESHTVGTCRRGRLRSTVRGPLSLVRKGEKRNNIKLRSRGGRVRDG